MTRVEHIGDATLAPRVLAGIRQIAVALAHEELSCVRGMRTPSLRCVNTANIRMNIEMEYMEVILK